MLRAQIETDAELKGAPSTPELLRALWRRFSDPKQQRQFLLLAEIYGLAIRDRDRFEDLLESTVHDFIAPIEEKLIQDGWSPDDAPAVATALLAQVRGLQLDVAATGDRERVDQAFAVMLDALLVRR